MGCGNSGRDPGKPSKGTVLNKQVLKSGVAVAILMTFVPQTAFVAVPAFAQQETTEQPAASQSGEATQPAADAGTAAKPENGEAGTRKERAERKKERRQKKKDQQEQTKEVQSDQAPAPDAGSGAAVEAEQEATGSKNERAERKKERAERKNERRQKKEALKEQTNQSQSEDNASQPAKTAPEKPAKKSAKTSGEGTMTSDEARKETAVPVTVSKDAAKPKEVVNQPIEQQVQEAEKRPTTVVPDQITDNQRQKLRAAEKRRREDSRRDRNRLLGAAAAGAVIGATVAALGGRVAADEGDRLVIERDGRLVVRKDESTLLRGRDVEVEYENLRGGYTREIITRPNGVQIISVRDPGGYVVKRVRIGRNGNRRVLFNSEYEDGGSRQVRRNLPRYNVDVPRERYIVSARRANRRLFRETFEADPVYQPEERYSLAEIRENEPIRSLMRRVDLDTINFETNSAYVSSSQVRLLGDIAGGMLDIIEKQPNTVFLIEGHTDAVGADIPNLVLSDRRAEAVARILIESYGIPPENLVTQGYGERFLKVRTEEDEPANRRATIRNITPILQASAD